MNKNILFQGIESHDAGEVQPILRDVLEQAPSDACVNFSLEEIGGGPNVVLKVFSSQAKFEASSKMNNDLPTTASDLRMSILEQIRNWKSQRKLS